MPEDAAILEAPEAIEAPDTPVDAGVEPESHEPEAETTETGETEAQPEAGTETSAVIDGKRLSEAAKQTLNEIRQKNPALAKQLKEALFESDALRRAGGLQQIQQIKQQLEEFGGIEKVQELQNNVAEWEAIDERFTSGDPGFIRDIAASDPDVLLKFVPEVLSQYEKLHPQGYTQYIAQTFAADMASQGVPQALEIMSYLLQNGDAAKAGEYAGKLIQYFNRISGFANQKVEEPKFQKQGEPDSRASELDEREANLTRTEWRSAADSNRLSIFNSEYSRLTAGRKVTDAQAAAIKELYVSRLQAALKKTTNFNQNIDRYFANKDRDGYLRYIGSIYKQEIPRALRAAVDTILPAKPGPRQNAPAQQRQAAATPNAPTGFIRVAVMPKKDQIDYLRTKPADIRENRAVLKDGRRVQW